MWLNGTPVLALASLALLHCSSSGAGSSASDNSDSGLACYPDIDGFTDQPEPIDLVVDDTGFYFGSPDSGLDTDAGMRTVITTQNLSTITFTLTNRGTKQHGFTVGCASVLTAYPNTPPGCPSTVCFTKDATINPIDPNTSTTIKFLTPAPDNVLFPFKSNAPGDANVPGLNGSEGSAWGTM